MSGEIRREDLPPKVVKEIEDRFHAELPGYEVKFAGDIEEELPADVQRSLEQLDAISKESMVNGTCIDCGEAYEPADDDGPHYAGCVCADCSDAEVTSDND